MKKKQMLLVVIILILLISLSACLGLRPTREYYINDFAEVFLEGTRDTFLLESKRLYDTTNKKGQSGTKMIVVTNLFENREEIESNEAEELFESWSLGDMDMLVYLAFAKNAANKSQLISVLLKIGDRLEDYVSTELAVATVQSTLFNADWEGNLDLGMGHCYYELLSAVYKNAYDYDTFDYDLEEFEKYIDEGGVIGEQRSMSAIGYIFSSYSPAWKKIVVLGPIILFVPGLFFVLRAKRKL